MLPDRRTSSLNALQRFLAEKAAGILASFREILRHFPVAIVLKKVTILLRGGLLCIRYEQRPHDQLRLLLGMKNLRGTIYREPDIESTIRLCDAMRAFVKEAEPNALAAGARHEAETEQMKLFFLSGDFLKLRLDRSENRGVRLFVQLPGVLNWVEVSPISAALIAAELDAFLSLRQSPAMRGPHEPQTH